MKEGLEKYFQEGATPEEVQAQEPADLKQEEDAVQQVQGQAEESVLRDERVAEASQEEIQSEVQEGKVEDTLVVEEEPQTIVEEKVAEEAPKYEIPENLEKLVDFMKDTGGTLEDYVNLNKSFDDLNEHQLLSEYYKKTKSHLDQEDISYLINKKLKIDEEEMDETELREKRIALKEEIGQAKKFLNDSKQKYYDEIKATKGGSQEADLARAKQEELVKKFQNQTESFFGDSFKGFEFKLGNDKTVRYKANAERLAKEHKDATNIFGRFLDEEGLPKDAEAYHKALFAFANADKIADLFYEQGRADAIKESSKDSKNIDFDHVKQSPSSDTKLRPGQAREIEGPSYTPRVGLKYTKF